MVRVPDNEMEKLTPEQKQLAAEIVAGTHTAAAVTGPYGLFLRRPDIARLVFNLGKTLRERAVLDRRLYELAVLLTSRHWGAKYEWDVHSRISAHIGMSSSVLEAIRTYRTPEFERDDEELVYELVTELNETKTLSQASYDRAVSVLGLEALIELITTIGLYTTIALTINVFELTLPDWTRFNIVDEAQTGPPPHQG